VSRFDDAVWHRQASRTAGGDAGPENAVNPSRQAHLLEFTAFTPAYVPEDPSPEIRTDSWQQANHYLQRIQRKTPEPAPRGF
jgi:hypothetical protein